MSEKATRAVGLSGGTATVSAVPPFPVFEYGARWERENPRPRKPTKKVDTIETKLSGEQDEAELKEGPEYDEYLKEANVWEYEKNMAYNAPIIVLGLKDHHPLPEDDSWADDLRMLKMEVPDKEEDELGYYFKYYQFTLLPTFNDVMAVVQAVIDMSFPSEERIENKMRNFPSPGKRSLWKMLTFQKE